MSFLTIKLVIIDNNLCLMHRDYQYFYAVHVYLRSIRISLVETLPYPVCILLIVLYRHVNCLFLQLYAQAEIGMKF